MDYQIAPRFFEDWNIGDRIITPTRTITETDVVTYAGLSGDYHLPHTDAEYAKKSVFGQRIVQGLLTIAIASGLIYRTGLIESNSIAILDYHPKWTTPVFIGDTVHCIAEIIDKKSTSKPDRGVLQIKNQVFNQHDLMVAENLVTYLYACRPKT